MRVCRCYIYAGDMDDQHVDSDSVLLSHLQHMQHLTHLSLEHNFHQMTHLMRRNSSSRRRIGRRAFPQKPTQL
jgi:hypothetical protein